MKELSPGEEGFALHCRAYRLNPKRELVFDSRRRWRFDFAWPEEKLAVEIEGGNWMQGRHTRPADFERDACKYNRAVELGWRVLRFTTHMVASGEAIDTVRRVLAGSTS